jgi:hypothetical protein
MEYAYHLELFIAGNKVFVKESDNAPFVPRKSDIVVIDGQKYSVVDVLIEYSLESINIAVHLQTKRW